MASARDGVGRGMHCARRVAGLLAVALSSAVVAQPAQLEIDGVHGECLPVYASSVDVLQLYRKPDLQAARVSIPYRIGWRVDAPQSQGMTRVLRTGSLRALTPDELMYCDTLPREGGDALQPGELVEYTHYLGEGFGAIRFRGARCTARVHQEFDYFEMIDKPEIQVWLRVFHADGTSPGWLFYDGSQTKVVRVRC